MKDKKLTLTYDDLELQIVSCEKILGVHFDDNLTWTNHFQQISKTISTYRWLLFQIKHTFLYNTECCFIMLT